jgi:acetyl esterase
MRALGTVHDFVMLNALAETPATRGAIVQATALLRQAFAGQM